MSWVDELHELVLRFAPQRLTKLWIALYAAANSPGLESENEIRDVAALTLHTSRNTLRQSVFQLRHWIDENALSARRFEEMTQPYFRYMYWFAWVKMGGEREQASRLVDEAYSKVFSKFAN